MKPLTIASVLDRLDRAVDFCSRLGVGLRTSRFSKYRHRIAELIECIEKGPDRLPRPHYEYVVPLCESAEFGEAIECLQKTDSRELKKKIKAAVKGPFYPIDENNVSNLARNTLFELNFAARIKRSGFQPLLGDRPDLSCRIGLKELLFECKRPFKMDNVRTSIGDAAGQIRAGLLTRGLRSRGAICISLSKALNPGDKYISAQNEASLRRGLQRQVLRVGTSELSNWRRHYRGDIIAVYFHTIAVAFVREPGMFFVAQHTAGFGFAGSWDDRDLLRRLTDGLMRTHY